MRDTIIDAENVAGRHNGGTRSGNPAIDLVTVREASSAPRRSARDAAVVPRSRRAGSRSRRLNASIIPVFVTNLKLARISTFIVQTYRR